MKPVSLGVITLVIFITLSGGCAAYEENGTPVESSLNTTIQPVLLGVWNCTGITAENGTPLVQVTNAEVTVNFTDSHQIFGKSGCNRYFGTYHLTGDTLSPGSGISVSSLGSTMMYCADTMEIEQTFLRILEKTIRYKVEEKTLFLTDNEGNVIQFIKSEEKENEKS